jgi:hypothetical protein
MRVLIGCEYSGRVRDAFIAKGHDAMSCDFLPTDVPGPHYQGNIFDIIDEDWDMLIAFPPCTHLCSSGARWWKNKVQEQKDAITFVLALADTPIKKIAIENPVGILSSVWRKPDCIIQPYEHGHGETKRTCLWLKNLPPITPTDLVDGRVQRIWRMPPSKDRWKLRSITYLGIAKAFADQWG